MNANTAETRTVGDTRAAEGRYTFYKTLIVVGTLISIFLLFQLRSIIILLFGAVLFASTIRPVVNVLEQRGLPRPLSILMVYLAALLALVGAVVVLFPTLFARTQELIAAQDQLARAVEDLFRRVQIFAFIKANVWLPVPDSAEMQQYLNQLQSTAQSRVTDYLLNGFQAATEVLLLFVMAFYWLTERDRIEDLGLRMIPLRHRERFLTIFRDVEAALGAYVRGQGIMSLTVGLFSFLGLTLAGVPYPLVLAVFAGITEAIPMIGPVLGAAPALLVALLTSPEKALLVGVIYLAIQQLEAHVLVPKIMERQVGLSPLLVILALASGNLLGGILGAVLAIPVAAALQILVRHLIVDPTVEAHRPTVVQGAVLVGEAPAVVNVETPGPVTVVQSATPGRMAPTVPKEG